MLAAVSIFLDFNLPNATTWFYFSFLLAVSLFFKFGRVLSMRNWDVVTIFLLVPGLMVVQASRPDPSEASRLARRVAGLVGQSAGGGLPVGPNAVGPIAVFGQSREPALMPVRWQWIGYLWLMAGSAYLLCRCLYDLVLVQRPALAPNLSFGGLAFLAIALLSCLIAVAFRPPPEREPFGSPQVSNPPGPSKLVGPEPATLALAREVIAPPSWLAWLARGSAVTCHLAVILGLILIGRRHFADPTAGMAAATFYLMLPYTGMFISQVHHVLPAAMIVWALLVYPWPLLAGILLGLATGTAYFPALLLPLWIHFYWGRGAGRFLAAFLLSMALTLTAIGLVLWMEGQLHNSIADVLKQEGWQPWVVPRHVEGFWTGIHAAYRIPVFVAYVVLVIATAVWPWPKNLAHLLALSTATIVGIQFWYADQGGVYVLWYLPLFVLLVFRPNLVDRRPPEINPDADWLTRMRRALLGMITPGSRSREPISSDPA